MPPTSGACKEQIMISMIILFCVYCSPQHTILVFDCMFSTSLSSQKIHLVPIKVILSSKQDKVVFKYNILVYDTLYYCTSSKTRCAFVEDTRSHVYTSWKLGQSPLPLMWSLLDLPEVGTAKQSLLEFGIWTVLQIC